MSGATVLMLVVAAIAIAAAARRYKLPSPLVLVVAGLGLSFVPWIPTIELNPDIVLFGVLPPLLFNAALDSSYVNLRANVRPIALLSVGLVLFTTVVVGVVAYLVAGDQLGWALALVLGAVVSPPDAVASTAVARNLKLPRRILTILSGESLLNDATALTAYRIALIAALGGAVSVWHGLGLFALAVGVGVGVGLALGMISAWLLCKLSDSLVEVAIFLLLPFGAYALAEEFDRQRRPGRRFGGHPDRPGDAEDALRDQAAGRFRDGDDRDDQPRDLSGVAAAELAEHRRQLQTDQPEHERLQHEIDRRRHGSALQPGRVVHLRHLPADQDARRNHGQDAADPCELLGQRIRTEGKQQEDRHLDQGVGQLAQQPGADHPRRVRRRPRRRRPARTGRAHARRTPPRPGRRSTRSGRRSARWRRSAGSRH